MARIPVSMIEFFRSNPGPALAFSGGSDSAYIMYVCRELGVDMTPYFVYGPFQTEREYGRVKQLSEQMAFELKVIELDVLSDQSIAINDADRCYHCKRAVFEAIGSASKKDGKSYVMDGTNASDDVDSRPGMRALAEMGIRSPLRECGLTKEDVRRLSKEAGLPTWDLPSDSCLATRIPTGTVLTKELLDRTERAENDIRELGFTGFRVRTVGNSARLEILSSQSNLLEFKRAEVEEVLLKYYDSVSYGERKAQRWNRGRFWRPSGTDRCLSRMLSACCVRSPSWIWGSPRSIPRDG